MRRFITFGFFLFGISETGISYATGSWQEQTSGVNQRINGVDFVDPSYGWVVGMPPAGGNSRVIHTTDGGTTWTLQSSGTPFELFAVDFVDQNWGWTVGKKGTILRTTNGGANWTTQSLGVIAEFRGVSFVNPNYGWIVGGNGLIFRTTNGGANWSLQTSGTGVELHGVFFLNQDEGWTVGNSGVIRHTTNGGGNWNAQVSGVMDNLRGISFVDASFGWVVGYNGRILRTTNGGANWTSQTSGVTANLTSVSFTDRRNGWVVGGGGTILSTTDGGTAWTLWVGVTNVDLRRVKFLDASYGPGWTVGEQGKIYRYDNNYPLFFTNIRRSSTVTITWKSIERAVYDVYAGDSLLADYIDIGDVEAQDTLSTFTDNASVSQRYYRVHSRSGLLRTSNTVGQYRLTVVAEDPPGNKMQLVSFPFVQYFTPIDSVIGAQLLGDESELYADRIWRWDPVNSKFRYVWLVDSVGPCCDGRWFETVDGTPVPTTLTLSADEGFWIQNRHGQQEIILVGEVSDDSNRVISLDYGIQEIGSAYPVVVELDSSELYEDGATGSNNELNADRVWFWDTIIDDWDFAWLIEGIGPPYEGRWWDSSPNSPTSIQFKPGVGYRFELRDLAGHAPFTWTYPKPYSQPPN